MANKHSTLTSLFDDIADALRVVTPVTAQIVADAFPAYIRMLGYAGTLPADPTDLNSCTWDFIRWASDQGIADLLWSVGDRKAVTIGKWGSPNLSSSWGDYIVSEGTYYCYILGFDHNSEWEGDNRIHFEFGFSSLSGGEHIAFGVNLYKKMSSDRSSPQMLRMNPTDSNLGGWEASTMRTGTLNGNRNSFQSAVPAELLNVIKPTAKYTDNVGGGAGSVESNVTATTDKFWVLNVFEIFTGVVGCNQYEKEKTKRYQYYINGNPANRYKSNDLQTLGRAFLRSPQSDDATNFKNISTVNGNIGNADARIFYCVSPCFCV